MTLSSGLIAAVALAYMAIMFSIAFYGDRRHAPLPPRMRAWVYSLSLAVYCTSWTFFGAVGQAAEQLWAFYTYLPGTGAVTGIRPLGPAKDDSDQQAGKHHLHR